MDTHLYEGAAVKGAMTDSLYFDADGVLDDFVTVVERSGGSEHWKWYEVTYVERSPVVDAIQAGYSGA